MKSQTAYNSCSFYLLKFIKNFGEIKEKLAAIFFSMPFSLYFKLVTKFAKIKWHTSCASLSYKKSIFTAQPPLQNTLVAEPCAGQYCSSNENSIFLETMNLLNQYAAYDLA